MGRRRWRFKVKWACIIMRISICTVLSHSHGRSGFIISGYEELHRSAQGVYKLADTLVKEDRLMRSRLGLSTRTGCGLNVLHFSRCGAIRQQSGATGASFPVCTTTMNASLARGMRQWIHAPPVSWMFLNISQL